MKYLTILLLLISFSIFGQTKDCTEGDGQIQEVEIELEAFKKINTQNSVSVFIKQADKQKVTVKGQKNLISLLNTKINNDNWEISFSNCIKSKETIEIHIETPLIEEIVIDGSGIVYSKNNLKSENLNLLINGSGDFDIKLNTQKLKTTINGSGNVKLIGKADSHLIRIEGSGDVSAYQLEVLDTEIKINGSGDVKISSSKSVDVTIDGSGDVHLGEYVEKLTKRINGSGEVIEEY